MELAFTHTVHQIKPRCPFGGCKNEDCVCAEGTEPP